MLGRKEGAGSIISVPPAQAVYGSDAHHLPRIPENRYKTRHKKRKQK
jgi:hypothetical protein